MGTSQQSRNRVSTGILSDGEREFFRGEKGDDIEDPDGYRRNARYRARQRMERIEKDLELLDDVGEDDLVDEFRNRFSRVGVLEKEVEQLREQLDED